jgi:hypothetical protein
MNVSNIIFILPYHSCYYVFLSMTNKMQRCIILFIIVNDLHVSSGFSAHHQELKSVHAESGICQTFFFTASGNSKQVWQIPDAACTDLSSWCWAEKPLGTFTALTIIKTIIQRCILLVMLKNILTMHGPMNVKLPLRPSVHSVCDLTRLKYILLWITFSPWR